MSFIKIASIFTLIVFIFIIVFKKVQKNMNDFIIFILKII